MTADGRLQCDTISCVYRADGRIVDIVRPRGDVGVACQSADLVISAVAARYNCHGALLIDSVDTWRRGGHAVWLERGSIAIESVKDWRGTRPWTHDPIPRRERERQADADSD